MRRVFLSLSALFLIWAIGLQILAQDKPAQQPTSSSTSETERPKNAVERALEEAKERGEVIYGVCIENCEGTASAEGVEPGQALELPKPVYPPIARAAHASGTVEVMVIIGLDGTVIAAASISGHPLLQAAAVSAARNSRFAPPKRNGEPVKVVGVLQYNFIAQ